MPRPGCSTSIFTPWLPGDILAKADRMSSAHSLELRLPYLDHILVEFAATIPPRFKIVRGMTKYILRMASARYLPEEVSHRPKLGFPCPWPPGSGSTTKINYMNFGIAKQRVFSLIRPYWSRCWRYTAGGIRLRTQTLGCLYLSVMARSLLSIEPEPGNWWKNSISNCLIN